MQLSPAAKLLVRYLTSYPSMCGETSSWESVLCEVRETTTSANNKADGVVKHGVKQLDRARRAFFMLPPLYSDALYSIWAELSSKIPQELMLLHPCLDVGRGQEKGTLVFLAAWTLKLPLERFARLSKGALGKQRVKNAAAEAEKLLAVALDKYEAAYSSLEVAPVSAERLRACV